MKTTGKVTKSYSGKGNPYRASNRTMTNPTYNTGKAMSKTSFPGVKLSRSPGGKQGMETNRKGDPGGCSPMGRGK